MSKLKLLGYANPSRIRMTCAGKPGGAHLGQVAIYAGESVDPMDIQEQENPTFMGEPMRPVGYLCVDKDNRPARSAELTHNEYHVAFVYKHSPHIQKLLDVAWPANAPHRLVPIYADLPEPPK